MVAPNHLRTLDPFVLFADIPFFIRWGALQRFFDGEDSIFNNNKNPLLCKLTAWSFKRLGLFPIDRDKDNWEVFKELYMQLKEGAWLGIFPEGTTNKQPDQLMVQEAKRSIFVMAKDTQVPIQPIALSWISQEERKALGIKHRLIVNYRPAFYVENSRDAQEIWARHIREGILENLNAVHLVRDSVAYQKHGDSNS